MCIYRTHTQRNKINADVQFFSVLHVCPLETFLLSIIFKVA